ncbi:hypothetical protein BHM03_00030357 [Ensete ventricosum]|nr:hypothetical protein BHM03_00030357 [Ensete ventricosum]
MLFFSRRRIYYTAAQPLVRRGGKQNIAGSFADACDRSVVVELVRIGMSILPGRPGSWLKPSAGHSRGRAGNGIVYPVLGIAVCVALIYLMLGDFKFSPGKPELSFVQRNGTRFVVDGRAFFVNGWNSYWLMDQSVEESSRQRVSEIFQTGKKMGMTVCRTWAFNDGAYHALQVSLGIFDERVFKLWQALDWVIVEARRHGIRLLLSLVNNLQHYGGKTQYEWIEEMTEFVKTIDKKHLLTIGLEGFYGSVSPEEKQNINPGKWLVEADLDEKVEYISKWITSHIEDGEKTLNKPIMFTEFGLSRKSKNFEYSHRIIFYKSIFNKIYESARQNGAGAGALIWQLLVQGMEDYNDDYGIVPGERPSVDKLIKEQSCQLMAVRYGKNSVDKNSVSC